MEIRRSKAWLPRWSWPSSVAARFYLAHVGDSRAYLVRNGSIRQLTEDHSLVAQMLKAGQLTAQEAPNFRLRNVVTRSLGNEVPSEVELATVEWGAGD